MSDQPAVEAVDPQAIVTPLEIKPLDIQHDTDPADDHGLARRIPHLGHAVVFFSLTLFFVYSCGAVAFSILNKIRHVSAESASNNFPATSVVTEAVAYLLALSVSARLFPRLWEKSFLRGIEWNFLAVQRRWRWLLLGGGVLSVVGQLVEARFTSRTTPQSKKSSPPSTVLTLPPLSLCC
jgi:hypothetical protein